MTWVTLLQIATSLLFFNYLWSFQMYIQYTVQSTFSLPKMLGVIDDSQFSKRGFKCNDLMADDPNLFCALKTVRDFGKLAGLNNDIKKFKAAFPVFP